MRTGWREATLGELCTLRAGIAFKKTLQGQATGDIPFIKVSDMNLPGNSCEIAVARNYLTVDQAAQIRAKPFPKETTVFAKIGEALRHNRVRLLQHETLIDNNMMGAVPDSKVVLPRFLFYLLSTIDLGRLATGTAVPYLTQSTLARIALAIPPLENQRSIASTLSEFDALAENIRKRLAVIEQLSELIYREWFVHFRYPGRHPEKLVASPLGPIPAGWTVAPLFDVAEVSFGYPFASAGFGQTGLYPVVRIRDVPKGTTETFTNEEAGSRYEVHNGDTLVGMDGEFYLSRWCGGPSYLNQRVARVRPSADVEAQLLHLQLRAPLRALNQEITGTTVAHLGKRHLEGIHLLVGDQEVMARARQTLGPLGDLALSLRRAALRLSALRDLLIPKLVSGQIDLAPPGSTGRVEAERARA